MTDLLRTLDWLPDSFAVEVAVVLAAGAAAAWWAHRRAA